MLGFPVRECVSGVCVCFSEPGYFFFPPRRICGLYRGIVSSETTVTNARRSVRARSCVFVRRVWLSKIWTGTLVLLWADLVELRWDEVSKQRGEDRRRRGDSHYTKSSPAVTLPLYHSDWHACSTLTLGNAAKTAKKGQFLHIRSAYHQGLFNRPFWIYYPRNEWSPSQINHHWRTKTSKQSIRALRCPTYRRCWKQHWRYPTEEALTQVQTGRLLFCTPSSQFISHNILFIHSFSLIITRSCQLISAAYISRTHPSSTETHLLC